MNGESDHNGRVEILREAMTMVLYLSIVLLATLTALPSGSEIEAGDHAAEGFSGLRLLGLIWGTSMGLALAHWFAFRLTARALGRGHVSPQDVQIGLAQIGAAVVVSAVCTIPVVLFEEGSQVLAATWVPAGLVGLTGYFVARSAERARFQAIILGGIAMLLGLTVAAVKNFLIGH